MFLDQKLYEIGHEVDLMDENSITHTIADMFKACLDDSHKHLNPDSGASDNDILPVFKRINTSWNMAVDRLNKQGFKFTVKDGFKLQMIAMVEKGYFTHLKHIIERI